MKIFRIVQTQHRPNCLCWLSCSNSCVRLPGLSTKQNTTERRRERQTEEVVAEKGYKLDHGQREDLKGATETIRTANDLL